MLPVTPKTWTSTTWPWATAFWTAVSAWTPTLSCCSRGVRRGRGTGPERGARTDDHLAAAKALWAQRPTDFDGPFTTLRAARLGVPPVTPGGPPVWVGGHSDAALLRALRFGDGWYGTGVTAAAGLTACTAWLPIAAEHVEKAMDWIAAEVIPHLT